MFGTDIVAHKFLLVPRPHSGTANAVPVLLTNNELPNPMLVQQGFISLYVLICTNTHAIDDLVGWA
jgi:hypothetical protein